MKRLTVIMLCFAFVAFNSCSKDDGGTTSETPEQLLTKSSWKLDEIRYSQTNTSGGGAVYYYKRGVTGNIGNLDNENVLFNANGGGTYTLGAVSSPLVWQFTNPEKTRMTFTINYAAGNPLSVNWENIVLTSTTLRYSEFYTTNTGITSIGSATRVH